MCPTAYKVQVCLSSPLLFSSRVSPLLFHSHLHTLSHYKDLVMVIALDSLAKKRHSLAMGSREITRSLNRETERKREREEQVGQSNNGYTWASGIILNMRFFKWSDHLLSSVRSSVVTYFTHRKMTKKKVRK